jgi:signal transduction histidine kinase
MVAQALPDSHPPPVSEKPRGKSSCGLFAPISPEGAIARGQAFPSKARLAALRIAAAERISLESNRQGTADLSGTQSPGTLAASIREYLDGLQETTLFAESATSEHLALLEVAHTITHETNPARLRSICLRKIATLLDLDAVRLYEVEPALGELRLTGSQEDPRARLPEGELGRGLASLRASRKRLGNPVSIEEALDGGAHSGGPGYNVLSIPIFFERDLWGVLQAATLAPRRMTPSASSLLETVAGLIGCGAARLAGAQQEREASERMRRRSERIVELHRRLRDVRGDLESKNRSLGEAMEHLRRMDTFKDAFLSSISHEMRTPLTIIRSYVDLLIHYKPETAEKVDEFLAVIDSETNKLTLHINKILDLTEIRANEVQIHVGVNAVEEIVHSAVEQVNAFYKEQSVALEVRIPTTLPAIFVDRARTIQILVDLLDNAAKFSPGGSTVTLSAQESPGDRNGPFVTFWVSDRGVGIEAEHQTKIFEQFSQITDTARGKPRGIGLGLPICKAYTERMGGKIWLESAPGHGSTFFVSLPGSLEPLAP